MSIVTPSNAAKRWLMIAPFVLASCGGGSAQDPGAVEVVSGGSAVVTPTPTPAATPTPTPTPAATATPAPGNPTTALSPSLSGVAAIPSNFNVNDYLQASWGNGAIPASMAPDVVGAFRFQCAPSHNAYDDPILFPGQPGRSHLHTFFGNTAANANSNYESLRTTGDSTCNNLLNRSAYWMPALLNGAGQVVMPDLISIYYKRRPSSDPECQRQGKACIGVPRGLRYIFGYNMSNPAASSEFYFNCQGAGSKPGHYKNIAQAAKACPVGAQLGAVISSPPCWNGTDLDSADHRSHMAFATYGNWGYAKCPATHPYIIPTFTIGAWYTTDGTLDRSGNESADAKTWFYASDRMKGMANQVPGSTFHADWFGAWDDGIMQLWQNNCIEKLLSCSGGDLGNGKQLKTLFGYAKPTGTKLVDPPRL